MPIARAPQTVGPIDLHEQDQEDEAGELSISVPGLAGFRHCDTVIVRADGVERLTYYPRDLASLIVAV